MSPKKPKPQEDERKDHVLQARVPKSLYNDLVKQAKRLRVPVSNLVRNILEDSVTMVETLVDGGLEIADALTGGASDEDLADVVGWQPMTAGRSLSCARCASPVTKGEQAFLSVGAPAGRTYVLCEECQCKL
jgi:hypothetical protein